MLPKRILQLCNIHVSNEMLEGLCKGSVDTIFVIKLSEDNKMKCFKKFASVDHESFNTFHECYQQKIKQGKTEYQKNMKKMIDLSQVVLNDRLKDKIVKEKLLIDVEIFVKNTLINDEIAVTEADKIYLNKDTINNNSVYFKLSNLISWKSMDLKSDDKYYNYHADEMYIILLKWLIYKL